MMTLILPTLRMRSSLNKTISTDNQLMREARQKFVESSTVINDEDVIIDYNGQSYMIRGTGKDAFHLSVGEGTEKAELWVTLHRSKGTSVSYAMLSHFSCTVDATHRNTLADFVVGVFSPDVLTWVVNDCRVTAANKKFWNALIRRHPHLSFEYMH